MSSDISGPPVKKRRSKWDVTNTEATPTGGDPATPTGAAAAAAAKINAMLAAKGKLGNSDNVILPPTKHTPIGTLPTTPRTTLLTPPTNVGPVRSTPPPPSHSFIQEKVFVGMENIPGFNVTDKLKGPDSSYLTHILAHTGGKAFLRGRGSGYIEPTSGNESFEALHIFISHVTREGVANARKLCQSLIDTVKREFDQYKASQTGPLGFGATPHEYVSNTGRPPVNPYAIQAPGYHGYRPRPPGHEGYYSHPVQGGPPPHHAHPGYAPPPGAYPPAPYPPDHPSRHINAFTDYRTYDKVDVSATNTSNNTQGKRQFTESSDDHTPNSPPKTGTKRRFTESTAVTERRVPVGVVSDVSDNHRRFIEKLPDPPINDNVVTNDDPPPVSVPVTPPQPPTTDEHTNKVGVAITEVGGAKNLMPPPSFPGGLKGKKSIISNPAPNTQVKESEGNKEQVKALGLSLLAHYADDSDSDNDL